jgi:hypothetical protein
MGLPGLDSKNLEKVVLGNRLLHISARICRVCHSVGIPWTIENPGYSIVWETAAIKNLVLRQKSEHILLDYCQFGERWRKRTRLQHSGGLNFVKIALLCHPDSAYNCSRTCKRHFVLRGPDGSSGQFKTHLAQAYPNSLCSALSVAIVDGRT